ncbi:hypothetical protein CVT25_004544 [Psilocybe cyanescens]|uniref:Uncharacterized protein n=1 Tax=Psilocybe cyanescens TaxID=93625 RepID=A0A409VYC4_PSICY|nr:hypothetical protein CVT25_004544 [Psilocybe cyanescens]
MSADQTMLLYSPSQSHLQLAAPATALAYTFENRFSPLHYNLTNTDFNTLVLEDGTIQYCLKQSTGVALWWTLNNIADSIVNAGVSPIRHDYSYPVAARNHIPDDLFHNIGMDCPEVLNIIEINTFNPLYVYTSISNIVSFWTRLQLVGLQALAWIHEARAHAIGLGFDSGWNWNSLGEQTFLEHVTRQLITFPGSMDSPCSRCHFTNNSGSILRNLHSNYSSDFESSYGAESYDDTEGSEVGSRNSQGTLYSIQINYEEQLMMEDTEPNICTDLVFHKTARYPRVHPTYNRYSKTELIDNGYIEDFSMDSANSEAIFSTFDHVHESMET